jgi:phospholipid/cholesterol/gamma-HCH transport system substrate-binding protein
MSRTLNRVQAFVLGASVLAILAVGGYTVFAVGDHSWLWGKPLTLRASFRQIHGVEKGTRVRILGKEAGEVAAVELPREPSGQLTLILHMDRRLQTLIRQDASAAIVLEGMLGAKVIEVNPGSDSALPVEDQASIATSQSPDLSDLLNQMNSALAGLGKREGSLGKLIRDDAAYDELLKFLRHGQGTLVSLKQNSDAIKSLPIVRSYVHDPRSILIRPDLEHRKVWFGEADLFQPGTALLTSSGAKRLDDLVPWLDGLKLKGSEIVVAAFAHPAIDMDLAQTLTQKQSETIVDYLKGHHAVQKMGLFSRRPVTALGCGSWSPAIPDNETLPLPRVEILVFFPARL